MGLYTKPGTGVDSARRLFLDEFSIAMLYGCIYSAMCCLNHIADLYGHILLEAGLHKKLVTGVDHASKTVVGRVLIRDAVRLYILSCVASLLESYHRLYGPPAK